MTIRDPRCDSDNCDYDEHGRWWHTGGCAALTRPLPVVNAKDAPAGSFLEFLAGSKPGASGAGREEQSVRAPKPPCRTTEENHE